MPSWRTASSTAGGGSAAAHRWQQEVQGGHGQGPVFRGGRIPGQEARRSGPPAREVGPAALRLLHHGLDAEVAQLVIELAAVEAEGLHALRRAAGCAPQFPQQRLALLARQRPAGGDPRGAGRSAPPPPRPTPPGRGPRTGAGGAGADADPLGLDLAVDPPLQLRVGAAPSAGGGAAARRATRPPRADGSSAARRRSEIYRKCMPSRRGERSGWGPPRLGPLPGGPPPQKP